MVEKMDQTRAKVIHRKLAQVARIERLVWLARTVAVLVAYAAAIGACHFALDWSWRPSAGPRSILLAGLLLAVGYLLWREVLLPLKRLPTREDVALEIERFFPPLGGRFISSYQLSQRPAGGSPQLIAQLIDLKITQAMAHTLRGELSDRGSARPARPDRHSEACDGAPLEATS